jgi:type IV secretory pathway VirB3-like protein
MTQAVAEKVSVESATLTKATTRAAKLLGINNQTLATILGLSDTTVWRMANGGFYLQKGQKEFELAVLFVRLYRSLDAIVSGDDKVAQSWLNNQNEIWDDAPINLIQKIEGLMNVVHYLDSQRARV